MRRLISVVALECYAVALAVLQMSGHVHTDEAKYLLNVPYPHPPLARWFLSLFDGFPWQELGARILFATLAVQAAWIVWDMGKALPSKSRLILCGAWLTSFGVVAGAGTVMMAPLTALQGLVFLWLYLRDEDDARHAGAIALFWLASLFTAYQAALFFPFVIAIFLRMKLPLWKRMAYVAVPLFLLCLYTLTNPFALASMLNQAGKDAAETLAQRASAFGSIALLAGSVVLGIAGTWGIIRSRQPAIGCALLLVCAYVFLGHYAYYMMLFVPFFVAGSYFLLHAKALPPVPFATAFGLCAVAVLALHSPVNPATPAREVMRAIADRGPRGNIAIVGSFGHEWQYESPYPVLKFSEASLPSAQTVVCPATGECPVRGRAGFSLFLTRPEVWIRGNADIGGN